MGLIRLNQMITEDIKIENKQIAEKLNYKLERNKEKGGFDVFNEDREFVKHYYGAMDLRKFLKSIDK